MTNDSLILLVEVNADDEALTLRVPERTTSRTKLS
jgi:hypothetical protein